MTLPSLSLPAPGSLEAERELGLRLDRNLTEQKKQFATWLYRLWLRWEPVHRGSRREFVIWFNGAYLGSHYASLTAGRAILSGFDLPGRRMGLLSQIGEALNDGDDPADIQARLDANEKPRRPQTEITTMQIPSVLAPQLQRLRAEVSESDKLNGPEAAARLMLAVGNQRPPMRAALLDTEGTGRKLVDALVYAIDDRRDYRTPLSREGVCAFCGDPGPGHLHHIKVSPDDRYRTNNVLVKLCERHHIARPGDTGAIHAMTIDEIERRYPDFWKRVALGLSKAAEASRPTAPQEQVSESDTEAQP